MTDLTLTVIRRVYERIARDPELPYAEKSAITKTLSILIEELSNVPSPPPNPRKVPDR